MEIVEMIVYSCICGKHSDLEMLSRKAFGGDSGAYLCPSADLYVYAMGKEQDLLRHLVLWVPLLSGRTHLLCGGRNV